MSLNSRSVARTAGLALLTLVLIPSSLTSPANHSPGQPLAGVATPGTATPWIAPKTRSHALLLRNDASPHHEPPEPSPPLTVILNPTPHSLWVPILLYHYVREVSRARDPLGYNLSVSPAMFHDQLAYLRAAGFHPISLHQLVLALGGQLTPPSRPVVLTFDDGYADFYTTAIPELLRFGFSATAFVITGKIGHGGYMTARQIQDADAMGFVIGDHTVDHLPLGRMRPADALWEMAASKTELEGLLGHPVLDLSYPFGSFNAGVEHMADKVGFECAVTSMWGYLERPSALMALYRLEYLGRTSLAEFASMLNGPPPTAALLRSGGSDSAPTVSVASRARPIPVS